MPTYPDAPITLDDFLEQVPGTVMENPAYSKGPYGLTPISYQALRNFACTVFGGGAGGSRVEEGLVGEDGSSGSTITIYRANLSAGIVKAAGLYGQFAAQPDVVLLDAVGATEWLKSYKLNGAAAVALTVDGKTYNVALIAVKATAGVVLCAVFGAEAADGAELAVTSAQIRTALDAALVATPAGPLAGLDTSSFVVINRVKIQQAGGVVTMTWTNPVTNSALLNERLGGTLGSLT
ncbi:MAG: hypothetical protein WCS88_04065 [Patescibacteria group bacterium]|jgi:hypothetical protein